MRTNLLFSVLLILPGCLERPNTECASTCGDGTIQCSETCDDGANNSNTVPDACRETCVLPACGDGVWDWASNAEECDDGNVTDGDGCDAQCSLEISTNCGDGNVDYADGEECDDGNNIDGDGCSDACRLEAIASCGDSVLDIANGEQCDDGNNQAGDGCSPTCQYELLGQNCGDDNVDQFERCDDGGIVGGDGCNPTCNFEGRIGDFIGDPGNPGYQEGIGTGALMSGWSNLVVDVDYVYFSDGGNNVIRRADLSGQTETLAGDGTQGYLDHVDGLQAQFWGGESIATDGMTLWVADEGNHRLRAIDLTSPTYSVTTVAGSGNVACTDGNGINAEIDSIRGLTYYNNHVYFLDANAAVLRRFDPLSGDVVTIAGIPYTYGGNDGPGPTARFQSPRYMASDNSGMLYISDTQGATIRSYNTVTDEVDTFIGTGVQGYDDQPGTLAQVHRPRGMTSDGTSIYWTEFNWHTVRQAVLATGDVSTLAGDPACGTTCGGYSPTGVADTVVFDLPIGLVYHYPTATLYVSDANAVIRTLR